MNPFLSALTVTRCPVFLPLRIPRRQRYLKQQRRQPASRPVFIPWKARGGVRGGISQGKERPVNPGHTCGNRHFRRRGYDGDPAGGKEKAASGYAKGRRQEAMAADPISMEEDTHPFTGGPENRGK